MDSCFWLIKGNFTEVISLSLFLLVQASTLVPPQEEPIIPIGTLSSLYNSLAKKYPVALKLSMLKVSSISPANSDVTGLHF